MDFAFLFKDERKNLSVGVPGQERERCVDVLVGAVACLEELLPLACLKVFKPEPYLAFVVADIGDVFAVRADGWLRKGAVFLVLQAHDIGGLVDQKRLIACFVKVVPFFNQCLVFFTRDIQ